MNNASPLSVAARPATWAMSSQTTATATAAADSTSATASSDAATSSPFALPTPARFPWLSRATTELSQAAGTSTRFPDAAATGDQVDVAA